MSFLRVEDYFLVDVECIPYPAPFDDILLAAIQSNSNWFVLQVEDKIKGCIRRQSIFEKIKNEGYSPSMQYEDMIVKTILVSGNDEIDLSEMMNKVAVYQMEDGKIKGVIDWNFDTKIKEFVSKDKWLLQELQAVFHNFYHSIFVTDGNGNVLKVSGKDDQEFVGRNVYDLERERAFYPSVTVKVLKSGKREKSLQYTPTGEVFMIESIPIQNEDGEIVRVVSITKDTSEVSKLASQFEELKNLLDNYQKEVSRTQRKQFEEKPLIFKSKKMQDIYEQIKSVASVDTSVLILGETGVGKQMIAKEIHLLSNRHDKPFITVNCGAIPDNLLESELFGYEEGAFSGARKGGKLGIFELADKGTVFLDEIGELPLQLQVKLLHVLQEKVIMRVGGGKPKKVDVRIITATNRNLEKMVSAGSFREDLYYRINIIPIHIPPLRERREDIHVLAFHFLSLFNNRYVKRAEIQEHQLEQLLKYSWTGNVRELENAIERFVVTGKLDLFGTSEQTVPFSPIEQEIGDMEKELPPLLPYLEEVEKQILQKAMARCKTTREMANCLRVNQSTIVRKIQKYHMGNSMQFGINK
ncbi:sigma-54 interaction domain-containing protein [Brevibacillus ginsengisoli]|uniref:sigma-54 interaction domain-containing protein n=1 Tax=Brevibacillus ginsengisoli TaxID=363854 RepID=UPI003CE929AC